MQEMHHRHRDLHYLFFRSSPSRLLIGPMRHLELCSVGGLQHLGSPSSSNITWTARRRTAVILKRHLSCMGHTQPALPEEALYGLVDLFH
jgi:hypothetical protein